MSSRTGAVLVLICDLTIFAACEGSGNLRVYTQCEDAEDCNTQCPAETAGTCTDEGLCLCTGTIPLGCDSAGDCSCSEGTPRCEDGTCYCDNTVEIGCDSAGDCQCDAGSIARCEDGTCHCDTTIENKCENAEDCECEDGYDATCDSGTCYCDPAPECEDVSDCNCGNSYVAECRDGACGCKEDHDCPLIKRRELVQMFYVMHELDSCPSTEPLENICSDVADGSLLACQWATLNGLDIIGPYKDPEGDPVMCAPNDLATRSTFVKMVIVSIDGLAGYQPPNVPTFDDVSAGAWYFDYVEAAVQLGLVQGYVNDDGSLSGFFGPGDSATTCWVDEVLARAMEYFPEREPETGYLVVNVNIPNGHYTVTNEQDETVVYETMGNATFPLPYGEYTVHPMDVTGYLPPSNVHFELSEEAPVMNVVLEYLSSISDLWATMNRVSGAILLDGSTDILAASYSFRSPMEARTIRSFDIINDKYDIFGDEIADTRSIQMVKINYLGTNGVEQTRSAVMIDGRASFSGLTVYVPKDGAATVDVYVDTCAFSDCFSGIYDGFRVGIDENTGFMAIGEGAQTQTRFEILGDEYIVGFGVRRSRPNATKIAGSEALVNDVNTLYGMTVTADPEGMIVIVSEMLFRIEGTTPVSNFQLWRGPTRTTATFDYNEENGDLAVFFNPSEGIPAGESRSYYLKAEATNVQPDDSIVTLPINMKWNDQSAYYNIMGLSELGSHTLTY